MTYHDTIISAVNDGEDGEQSDHLHEAQPFEVLGLDEIAALKPPEYLVDKILPEGAFGVLLGPYASLKSFLALDLSLSIAYGIDWHGRAVKQRAVIYIAGEGAAGMGRRITAWRATHGMEDVNAPFFLIRVPFNLMDTKSVARLVATQAAVMAKAGHAVGLVVNDTLARSMIGADENTAQDMGRAVANTDEIRAGGGCAVLTVHHMGKDKERGARGSSALPGATDTLIEVERAEDELTVTVRKQKDDEEEAPFVLMVRKVGLDGGEPKDDAPTSLVLDDAEPGRVPGAKPRTKLTGDQQLALAILQDAIATHGQPGFAGVPPGRSSIPEGWWRDRFYERAKPGADPATKQKAFRRAADGLVAFGAVAADRGRVWVT